MNDKFTLMHGVEHINTHDFVTRHPEDGHKCDRNMLVGNNIQLNVVTSSIWFSSEYETGYEVNNRD
jgi:hypothetical protein